ncbi:MAG: hypothetical protein AAGI90_02135 [Chlamydiota bacterium]
MPHSVARKPVDRKFLVHQNLAGPKSSPNPKLPTTVFQTLINGIGTFFGAIWKLCTYIIRTIFCCSSSTKNQSQKTNRVVNGVIVHPNQRPRLKLSPSQKKRLSPRKTFRTNLVKIPEERSIDIPPESKSADSPNKNRRWLRRPRTTINLAELAAARNTREAAKTKKTPNKKGHPLGGDSAVSGIGFAPNAPSGGLTGRVTRPNQRTSSKGASSPSKIPKAAHPNPNRGGTTGKQANRQFAPNAPSESLAGRVTRSDQSTSSKGASSPSKIPKAAHPNPNRGGTTGKGISRPTNFKRGPATKARMPISTNSSSHIPRLSRRGR